MSVPGTDVLIEGARTEEHACHIRRRDGVPGVPRSVHGLIVVIKGVVVIEHVREINHLVSVPGTDVLIEGARTEEHVLHLHHGTGIPEADILIEVDVIGKHIDHIGHIGGTPGIDILIERCTREHASHVGDIGSVPGTPRSIERCAIVIEGSRLVKHVSHIGHGGGVPRAEVLIEGVGCGEHKRKVGYYCRRWKIRWNTHERRCPIESPAETRRTV